MEHKSIWQRFFPSPGISKPEAPADATEAEPASGGSAATMQSERPLSSAKEDRLDRSTFANRVAGALAERPAEDSIVVGLYGPWGDGKTSALSMIKERLRDDASVVIVEYNPWFFSSDPETITRSFFLTIGQALERSGFFSKENIGDLLAKYGGAIPNVGDAMEKFGQALSIGDLTSVRDHVERILRKHRRRVVVFVDDIDRLDRKEIQTLFKLVRLSGDFPYTSYVLAFDDGVVTEALGEAYGGGDNRAGRRFLEKIIQVPLHLPPASPDTLRTMAFESCSRVLDGSDIQLDETKAHEFANLFAVGFMHALKTPRQVKLYDNALSFAVPMLKGEVNVTDQMLIEAIRIFHPSLYAYVRDHPDRFLEAPDRERRKEVQELGPLIRDVLADTKLSDEELRAVSRVVEHLFPRTSRMGYGGGWDETWSKARRICAKGYFRRYFTYGVPIGDLADGSVAEIVAAAEEGAADRVAAVWREALEKKALRLLISKLRVQEDTLPAAAIALLTRQVAGGAGDIPRSNEPMMGDWGFRQAAILISHLIARAGDQRDECIREVIACTPILAFGVEVLEWSRQRTSEGKALGFLDEGAAIVYYRELWGRLMKETGDQSPLEVLGGDFTRTLFGFKRGGLENEVREYLRELVANSDGQALVALLQAFSPQSWDLESGAPIPSDFERHCYDAVAALCDPEQVLAKLGECVTPELDASEFPHLRDDGAEDPKVVLARQFAYLHKYATRDESANPDDEAEPATGDA